MSSPYRSELNTPIPPLMLGLAAAVVAYLLSVVVARALSPPEVATPLWSISALVIAFVSIIVAFTALTMVLAPPIDRTSTRAADSVSDAFAIAFAARKEANAALARTSPWWHYAVNAIGGFTFGVLLALEIAWFLG